MATASSYVTRLRNEVNSLTECVICKETLKDGRMLPCLHSFCLECLKRYGENKSHGDNIDCPICKRSFKIPRNGFEELPGNHFINKLIDIQKLMQNERQENEGNQDIEFVCCNQCKARGQREIAGWYCINCRENLCESCYKRHTEGHALKTHRVVTLDNKPSLDELLKLTETNCKSHEDETKKFYCSKCKTTICVVCCLGQHKGHKCPEIKIAVVELKRTTDTHAKVIEGHLKETQDFIRKVDLTIENFDEQVDRAKTRIEKRRKLIDAQLDKHYKEITKRLEQINRNRKETLQTLKEEGQQNFSVLQSFNTYWNEVKARGSDCDIIEAAIILQKRFDPLIEQHKQQLNSENSRKSHKDYCRVEYKPTAKFVVKGTKNILGELICNELNAFEFGVIIPAMRLVGFYRDEGPLLPVDD